MARVVFTVNGVKCSVDATVSRDTTLNAYIRYTLALPGTKAMCHEGGCGACLVTVKATRYPSGRVETFTVNSYTWLKKEKYNNESKPVVEPHVRVRLDGYYHLSYPPQGSKVTLLCSGLKGKVARESTGTLEVCHLIPQCLVLILSCNGWDITTIEGVGNRKDGYSEIQKRMAAFNATQCGYCTPGWIMHMNSLQDKNLTMAELEKSFASNTCRCTGYRPILDTMKSFAVDASPKLCQMVKDMEDLNLCPKTKAICDRKCSVVSTDSDWTVVDDSIKIQEEKPIFFDFGVEKFYKVYTVSEIFDILNDSGVDSYMLVDGNTGKGVFEDWQYPRVLIDISEVKELKGYRMDQNLVLGTNISLEDSIKIFKDIAKDMPEFNYLLEFVKHFELIANMPVRKLGSLAGNLMLKHSVPMYQSDVFLLLSCVGAMVTIQTRLKQIISLSMTQFLKYDMKGAILMNIELPPLNESYKLKSYKIMPRNQNALAIVNAAFCVKMDPNNNVVDDIWIVYGNIAPDFVYAEMTEAYLKGKHLFDNNTVQGAIKVLLNEIEPQDNPIDPAPGSRKKLAVGLFYKFILSICPTGFPSPSYRSGGMSLQRPVSHGTQDYQSDPSLYPLNQPVPKYEAMIQCAGEAEYANDIPPFPKQVFGAFVLSQVHSGEVDEIFIDEILAVKGVRAVYTSKDIPGRNSFGVTGFQLQTEDEEVIVSKDIKYYGQPIAILVADTEALAKGAAKRVRVTYKNVSTSTPVLNIDDASKDSKRYKEGESDAQIEPKSRGNKGTKIIKGVYNIEAQYHYYMEPMTCVVKPVDRMFEVYDASQWMDLTQAVIAQFLGIRESDVLVYVRRVGGGFGGKVSRNAQVAAACALVAQKMNMPCRFILPLQTNLTIAGRRLPTQCKYEVHVDDDGKIQYLDATIVEDDGCSHNENILSYTAGGFVNCYDSQYFSLKTGSVLTDLPSNTFARAPGTQEGIACIEHIMEHIAYEIKKDATEVRRVNMKTDDNDIPELIDILKKDSDYDRRLKEIEEFNKANRWTKRAIKISVMLFPVEYYGNYSAMVSIYRGDGTVTVSTGGIEMGQGVNTKVSQVCAYELGIPLEYVSILPSYSYGEANNVFSGSSIVSESVCYSVIRACRILKERIAPVKAKMKNASWKELIKKAGEEQVDLTATYMMTDMEPELKSYSAFGVTILEVQIDVLVGRFNILRLDVLEDVGLSANPNIDVGQVEGAYIQGVGYYTTEKFKYDKKTGKLLSNRSLTYHVPLALDIPIDFRIKLRYNSKNPKGVMGSKAVGEMGICLSHGITHALRACINESRNDSGYDSNKWIDINVPYDTESILEALDVKYEEFLITK